MSEHTHHVIIMEEEDRGEKEVENKVEKRGGSKVKEAIERDKMTWKKE